MPRFWTTCWQNRYWRDDVNSEYQPVCGSGGNQYRKRGVTIGDSVYVVSCFEGRLLLGGRMVVKRIVNRQEAVEIWDNDNLYDATEWIIDEQQEGTPLNLHRQLGAAISRQLRFVSQGSEPKGLFFISENSIYHQTIRGVRELTPESAALFDRVIAVTDAMPRSYQMITVTEELLRRPEGINDEIADQLPGELREDVTYFEGAIHRVLVNRYERNPAARAKCIEHYGATCVVCGFEFGASYGSIAEGFMHVHHMKPLSEIDGEYKVDPIVDMRPVCPNCHAVIHLGAQARSIDEVKRLLPKEIAQ